MHDAETTEVTVRQAMLFAAGLAFALSGGAAAEPAVSGEAFVKLPAGTLKAQSARWGEWIADVEKPAARHTFPGNTKYSPVKLTRAAPSSAGSGGTAGRVTGIASDPAEPSAMAGRGLDIAAVDGEVTGAPPAGRGSVVLALKQPWPECAAGTRFNGIYLTAGASHRYQLDGAEVARCGGSSVTLNYSKVTVKGWNPEKKEE
jgi:hypothetical protein